MRNIGSSAVRRVERLLQNHGVLAVLGNAKTARLGEALVELVDEIVGDAVRDERRGIKWESHSRLETHLQAGNVAEDWKSINDQSRWDWRSVNAQTRGEDRCTNS